jgi:hypothetical protein
MKTRIRSVSLLIAALFWASPALPSANQIAYRPRTISNRLKELPNLRPLVLKLMRDPAIRGSVKRIIKRALEDHDAHVRLLTAELKVAHEIPKKFTAYTFPGYDNFSVGKIRMKEDSANEALSVDEPLPDNFVAVQDRKIDSKSNDLITLIHELAHIRFYRLIDANAERIGNALPSTHVRRSRDGHLTIDSQLFHYLQERYAFEVEFDVFADTYGRYYDSWFWRYDNHPGILNEDSQSRDRWLRKGMREIEGLGDPILRKLDKIPLSYILLGAPSANELR